MNLAFATIVDLSGHSGQNIYNREMATALGKNQDINLSLVCPMPNKNLSAGLDELIVDRSYFKSKRSGSPSWHVSVQYSIYSNLRMVHKRVGLDGIVLPLRPTTITPILFARRHGIPLVTLVETFIPENITRVFPAPGISWFANAVARVAARESQQVFAADEASADWMASFLGVDSSSVSVFTHPVNTDRFYPQNKSDARQKYLPEVSDEAFVFGFAGSFRNRHRLDDLVRGFNLARERTERPLHLLLIGDGPRHQEISDLSINLGVRDLITFPGFVSDSDIGGYLAASDVLCCLRDKNVTGSPLKLYEYFACGRPVLINEHKELMIATDIGAGRQSESVAPAAIADVMLEFVGMDDSHREGMGETGIRFIYENNRTWSHFAETIRDTFHQHCD